MGKATVRIENTIESPLNLRWDDTTYQYKVNKHMDQSGIYVDLEVAQQLVKERELLIEALENVLDKVETYMPQVNTGNEKQVNLYFSFHKAKELLNNLKK